ncbi:MAG TPA: stage II sporulation protein D [Firmicutes bacterium]|nr:stage II sporulation protein D [Bacillota bacterium]
MRRGLALTLLAIIVLVIFLPAAVVSIARRDSLPHFEHPEEAPDALPANQGLVIRLYRTDQKQVVDLDLEEYLIGVVAAEMAASFELEALKAQAVASRTYALRRCRFWGGCGCNLSSEPADLCSDSTHCQAWIDPGQAALGWPDDQKDELLNRITTAVRETAGEIAVYNGELIEAVYHSTCGGLTECSYALWGGGEVPYLQSVSCPYCGHSPYYRTQNLITYQTLAAALPGCPARPVSGGLPVEIKEQTPGGRVGQLKIGDQTMDGKDFRNLFQLPSLACSFQEDSQGLVVNCKGKGHGVGLCQYGADGAASRGMSYREIISFYYCGAEVTGINP